MIRKLQSTGRLNFVTLPNEWVRLNNLKKGDPLECSFTTHQLTLRPEAAGVQKRRLEITINESEPEGLIHMIIGAFESGFTEFNIKLSNKLSEKDIKYMKKSLIDKYSMTTVDIKPNNIKASVFIQSMNLEYCIESMFNSVINVGRAALIGDKDLVKSHERQVQTLRFTIKRIVNLGGGLPNWIIISEALGLTSRIIWLEQGNKDFFPFFEKTIELLQRLLAIRKDIDKLIKHYPAVEELKKITFIKGRRDYALDRIYRNTVNIFRELVKINISLF